MEAQHGKGMRQEIKGFSTYGEPGQGQYAIDSLQSCRTAEIAATYATKAIDRVDYDRNCGRPFTICEYGAADGLTSVHIMTKIIEHVRGKYGKDTPITIIYEDRPNADFNSLFLGLSGQLTGPFPGYHTIHQNVFVFATGRDFFLQCMPNDSVHFAYSAAALHYMSERPCQLHDVIHVAESRDPIERSMFATQAAKDWHTILLLRASELAPGGQMVLCVAVTDGLGQYTGKTRRMAQFSMYDALAQPWKEMIQEGRISQEEFADMSFNSYLRSVEEFIAPFKNHTTAVYRAGLRLVAIENQITPCPVYTEWLKRENKDNMRRQAFAKKAVAQVRCWSNWLFVDALKKNRPLAESVALVEEYWKRFEQSAAANLDQMHFDIPFAHIWVEKVMNT